MNNEFLLFLKYFKLINIIHGTDLKNEIKKRIQNNKLCPYKKYNFMQL